jgi:hypothetical protein
VRERVLLKRNLSQRAAVGLLPFISIASVWQQRRPVATNCAAYRRQLTIDPKLCRTEMLGDLTANYHGIPRSYYRFGTSWLHVRGALASELYFLE